MGGLFSKKPKTKDKTDQRVDRMFQAFDIDKSGALDPTEISKAFERLDIKVDDTTLNGIIELQFGDNTDGEEKLSKQQFSELYYTFINIFKKIGMFFHRADAKDYGEGHTDDRLSKLELKDALNDHLKSMLAKDHIQEHLKENYKLRPGFEELEQDWEKRGKIQFTDSMIEDMLKTLDLEDGKWIDVNTFIELILTVTYDGIKTGPSLTSERFP